MGSTITPTEQRTSGPSLDPTRVVVVGHDGSPSSQAALAHGALRAGPGGRVIIVRAMPAIRRPSRDRPDPRRAQYVDAVASLLAAAHAQLRGRVAYEIRVVARPPAEALADAAQRHRATTVVIGSGSGRAPLEPTRVAAAVRARTRIPVAIVPARPRGGRSPRTRDQAPVREEPSGPAAADPVEQRGLESFPASDPPPWWAGPPNAGRGRGQADLSSRA